MKTFSGPFARFILSARESCRLSREDVCRRLQGLTPELLSRYENEEEPIPPQEILRLLAFYEQSLMCLAAGR